MTGLLERAVASNFPAGEQQSRNSGERETLAVAVSEEESATSNTQTRPSKASLWSSFIASTFTIFETERSSGDKEGKRKSYGWTSAVKKVVSSSSMRRLQERILGTNRVDVSSSNSDIWLLGINYKVSPEESSDGDNYGLDAFLQDFSSRIWITYRKGFDPIVDTKFVSDVNWGCMIRSSQMLVAQAMLFHHLGRSWRKPTQKPYEREYVRILHHFGDSGMSAFSIHNLLQAGRNYGLAAGSWVGPYAMCRAWATLTQPNGQHGDKTKEILPMVVYVVSGDEDGERGGAPVICIDNVARLCSDATSDHVTWLPILLLVPLVLGLEKINPRYIPLLCETFTFPQSLGILGGKTGASTYIVGVQDNKALYLDPHEVQQAVDIKEDDFEAETSSYHCSVVRQMQLDLIDPSLAIGFYCRDKDDFDDFCSRASALGDRSNGAPLFTVTQSPQSSRTIHQGTLMENIDGSDDFRVGETFNTEDICDDSQTQEDEWQIL
ncbi:Peptidase C54 protein [Dioscorea alata]|uniref:Peptidase C54 protein n=2 Tax=Dioscorea alata TaxID=55571 RepID=A0ACB7W3I6_DIOAL|nr:Peptidase C54 protein [Dioscorea alata]KAH7682033.1 Peptidase C54 protein [Dioscorea alata]